VTVREEPRLRVAVFRPDDERMADAVALLESLGADPVADPMLAVDPTGARPRGDADYVVFTSKTGVEIAAGERGAGDGERDGTHDESADPDRWEQAGATVCAIGASTAAALRATDYRVDRVPEEYTSGGLVDALEAAVAGARVEVARSDHGSAVLLEGLDDAGAYVHETVLYRLARPDGAGESAELAAAGELDAAAFTSSLTVEHFLAAAAERGVRDEAIAGLDDAVVGTIGDPTRETAEREGIDVDLVPDEADFEALACAVVEAAAPSHHGA
jgi:uroporphyrinogen-III synthase